MSQTRTLVSFVTLASVLGFAGIASAQSPTVADDEPVTVATPESSDEARSGMAAKREGNVVAVYIGPFLEVVGAGSSLGVGVHVARDTLVELDLMGSASFLREPMAWASTSVGVRHFVGDSFYLRGGVRYGLFTQTEETGPSTGPTHRTERVVHEIGPDVGLGHRAQWGPITFGVDWLGVHVPVVKIEAKDEQVRNQRNAIVSKSSSTPVSVTTSRIQIRLLHLQVGVTF